MEEDGDDLDNLFEEYESNDRQAGVNDDNNQIAENETDAAEPVPVPVPVPKRVIRNPRVKFNPERLIGKRGIPVVVNHFKDVKFKGKGHEKEDLKKLLTTLELWTHRLFPSMKFEACLQQIEKLGKKRPVQTCLRKIRLDMPILDQDFVQDEVEERVDEVNEMDAEPPQADAFDRLFNDYQQTAQPALTSTPRSSQSAGVALGTSFGGSLTEEQKQRMELNKLLATERRKSRLAAMQTETTTIAVDNTASAESTSNLQSAEGESEVANINNSESLFCDLNQHFEESENSVLNNEEQLTQPKHSEELGLDDLMDLVDKEDDEDNSKNMENESINSPEPKDSEELVLNDQIDLVNENRQNKHLNEKKEESFGLPQFEESEKLVLDRLMDLVDEKLQKEDIDKEDKDSMKSSQPKYSEELEFNDQNGLIDENNQNGKKKNGSPQSEELGSGDLMDMVNEEFQNEDINAKDKDSMNSSQPKRSEKIESDEAMDFEDEEVLPNENGQETHSSAFKDVTPTAAKGEQLDSEESKITIGVTESENLSSVSDTEN